LALAAVGMGKGMGRTAQCLKTARGGLFTISFFSFLSFFNFLSHYRQKICKRETNGLLRELFPAPGQQYIGVFFFTRQSIIN
jgi:hypothetical protein